jgi:hypothetical protein
VTLAISGRNRSCLEHRSAHERQSECKAVA